MNTFVGLFIFATAVSQVESASKVHITVFYESLCPDSVRFVRKQLYPTYKELKNYMEVELVPFGKAYYTTNPWSITCQHGRHECLGNAVQACALARYSTTDMRVKFVNCVMSEYNPTAAAKKCAKKLNYSYEGINECSTSEEGRQLLAKHGDRTRSFRERLTFVPTVLFNNGYSDRDQKEALKDLRSVVCRKINPTPAKCSNPSVRSEEEEFDDE